MNALRQLRLGLIVGTRDFTFLWNWKTWLGGWMVQMLAQAAFFSMFARLFDSPDHERFLLIGNAVAVGVHTACWGIVSTTWDRWTGVYPLLVIAPTSMVPAVFGRTSVWLASAVATSLITFLILGAIFDLGLPWPNSLLIVPLVFLTCASTFCFSVFIGALITRQSQFRNLVMGIVNVVLRAFCGISVPITFWPGYTQFIVKLLPITHGLEAIRFVLEEASISAVLQAAALEAAVGLGWIILVILVMDRVADAGRKDGSIEFI